MRSPLQTRLEIAAAERDLLVAKLNELLGEAGVVDAGRFLDVAELVRLADHVRAQVRGHRSLSALRCDRAKGNS